jgi:hypothetical protein
VANADDGLRARIDRTLERTKASVRETREIAEKTTQLSRFQRATLDRDRKRRLPEAMPLRRDSN